MISIVETPNAGKALQGSLSTASTATPKSHHGNCEQEFVAKINHTSGSSYGCAIKFEGSVVTVERVDEGGLIGAWNRENVNAQIEVGDMIVDVNRFSGSSVISREMGKLKVVMLRVRKSGLTGSAVVTPRAPEPSNCQEFWAMVNRTGGRKWGFVYEALPCGLRVAGVRPDGAIAVWNAQNQQSCIEEGDIIVEVNQVSSSAAGASAMERLLGQQLQSCDLRVRKAPRDPLAAVAWSRIRSEGPHGIQLTQLKDLTSGNFGKVSLVFDRALELKRVRKVCELQGANVRVQKYLRNEAVVLMNMDHPAVIRMFRCFQDASTERLSMILEYMPGGGMESCLLKVGRTLPETSTVTIMQQLLAGLAYCHGKGVVHRDVKPANVTISGPLSANGPAPLAKLIDFGLCSRVPVGKAHGFITRIVGTPPYMALEVIDGAPYTDNVDVWSTGLMALELLTSRQIFGENAHGQDDRRPIPGQKSMDMVRQHSSPGQLERLLGSLSGWGTASEQARSFVKHCLDYKARQRPSALAASRHPWLHSSSVCTARPLADGFARFVDASPCEQLLAFVLAAKHDNPDEEWLNFIFLAADKDCDGHLSRTELATLLDVSLGVTAEAVLIAAGFGSRTGALSYTEFLAICIFARRKADELPGAAFRILSDGHERATVSTLKHFCRQRDIGRLRRLPAEFTEADLRSALLSSASDVLGGA